MCVPPVHQQSSLGRGNADNSVLAQCLIPKLCSVEGMMDIFHFGLTPSLAEWQGRRKCVKGAGGVRAEERRLTVFISVTYCRHCLHFLLLSHTDLMNQ